MNLVKICAVLTRHRFRKKIPCVGVGYSLCRCCGKLIMEGCDGKRNSP